MSHHTLHLSSGTSIPCDALLLGTGFQSSLTFMPEDLKAELGVPHKPGSATQTTTRKWDELEAAADKEVLQRFPILANPPEHYLKTVDTTPYRLYRGIAPIHNTTRDIVFVNHLVSGNMIMNAEAQAHWAVAYLSDQIKLPPVEEMERDVATQVAYCKRRSLSTGQLGNFFAFDMIAYIDGLMKELGVDAVWKRKGAFGVNRPEDLGEAWRVWEEERGKKV
jgi:dimethylaniline monooxygenase (N-oxide forming)